MRCALVQLFLSPADFHIALSARVRWDFASSHYHFTLSLRAHRAEVAQKRENRHVEETKPKANSRQPINSTSYHTAQPSWINHPLAPNDSANEWGGRLTHT
ncbi:hypothetical protein B0H12DRAFT_372058 [Mycena haematopus]|nr:hypothetical protein B0H12DRAFT_372058 [Mycena haematopus]